LATGRPPLFVSCVRHRRTNTFVASPSPSKS
jgi:hypothetical protein